MFWSEKSPDINPIENQWAYMEGKLTGQKFADTEELWKAVKFDWENVDSPRRLRLTKSVVNRLTIFKKSQRKSHSLLNLSYFCVTHNNIMQHGSVFRVEIKQHSNDMKF